MKTNNQIWTDLSALTFLCLLTRVPWLFMVPMAQAPDEFSHYWVVKFIFEHARLPSHADVFSGGPSAVYGPLPQVGYLPHILLSKLLPFWDLTITARLGSLFMGLALIVAVYFIARELYPRQRLATLALPSIVLLHPQMVLLDAYINCDSTAAFLAALIFLLVIRLIKNGLSLWECSALGVLAGLAALSKYASLAVALGAGVGVLLAGWINGASLSLIVAACGVAVSFFALTCNWWVARELHEYPGDVLGTQTMRHIWAHYNHQPMEFKMNVWHIIKNFSWWRMTYFSYWGMFGYMTVYLYRPFYIIYFVYTLLAIAGGVGRLLGIDRIFTCLTAENKDRAKDFIEKLRESLVQSPMPKFLAFLKLKARVKNNEDIAEEDMAKLKYTAIYLVFFISLIINLAAMIWSSSLNLGGAQGRYLFGCEVPIVALTVSGILTLNEKWGSKVVVSFVVFNLIVYVWSFVTLLKAYGGFLTRTY